MAGERTVRVRFDGDARGLNQAAESGEKSVGKWGDAVSKAGSVAAKASAVAGAAVAAALASAVGAGLEQSQVKAKLAAQLGATGADAKKYGDAAGALYGRGVVESIEEAADVVKGVLQNNLVPKDAGKAELDAVAARVSNLATTMGEDASSVSRAVSQMLKTGLASSATEAFDLLAKGTQLGINSSEDLLDTFNEYGTQFRKLGLDGPTAMGLLSQGLQGGARDADVVADALKELSIRAIDGSKTTAAGFAELGLNGKDMAAAFAKGGDDATMALSDTLEALQKIKDPIKQNAAATALFGTQSEDLGKALFSLDLGTASTKLGDFAGAADKAGKTLEQSAGAKVAAFQRQLQDKLINTLAGVVDWIGKNETLVKNLALALGPLVAVIGTLVAIIKIWTAVQAALNFVMTANPIGLVIVAVGLIVAGITILATKTQFFQTIWEAVWGAIKAAASAVASWFTGTLVPSLQRAWDTIKKAVGAVGAFFKAVWDKIVSGLRTAKDAIASVISGIGTVIGRIKDYVQSAYTNVTGKFASLVSYIRGLPGKITSAASGMFDGIKSAFKGAINWIIDKWNNLSFSLPSINTPFGKLGGTTLSTPNIPHLASGGWMQPGKTYLTGENGRELITSAKPAYVSNANDTNAMLGTGGGDVNVTVYLGTREITDIVDVQIAKANKQTKRGVLQGAAIKSHIPAGALR